MNLVYRNYTLWTKCPQRSKHRIRGIIPTLRTQPPGIPGRGRRTSPMLCQPTTWCQSEWSWCCTPTPLLLTMAGNGSFHEWIIIQLRFGGYFRLWNLACDTYDALYFVRRHSKLSPLGDMMRIIYWFPLISKWYWCNHCHVTICSKWIHDDLESWGY